MDGLDISETGPLVVIDVGCMGVGIVEENWYHTNGYEETMFLHLYLEIFSYLLFETVVNAIDIFIV